MIFTNIVILFLLFMLDLNENPSVTIVVPPEVLTNDNLDPSHRNLAIKARPTHVGNSRRI
jgi:hypothetical protein